MCIVQHMIQSATDTRSRGSSSVSSADFYMMCMFARVTVLCAGQCRNAYRYLMFLLTNFLVRECLSDWKPSIR